MRRIRMLSFTLLGSAVLLAGLVALASLPAAPSVHADSIIVLQPRTPLNGRFVSHDIWDQVESVWTCKIIRVDDTIFDACNYEDVFPLPEPPPWKRRLVDQGGRWVCVPTPVELSPIQAPFVKGLCLFADENQEFPNSFEPTAEQLEQSAQDQNRLMRGLLALDPAVAAQNPEQAYYLKSQKDAARRQIFGLATLNNRTCDTQQCCQRR